MRTERKELVEGADETRKKRYSAPTLTRHGDASEITRVLRLARTVPTIGTEIDTG